MYLLKAIEKDLVKQAKGIRGIDGSSINSRVRDYGAVIVAFNMTDSSDFINYVHITADMKGGCKATVIIHGPYIDTTEIIDMMCTEKIFDFIKATTGRQDD